jgi:hypothetical protein
VAEGTEIFRKALDLLHFKPVKDFAALNPEDCILIMLGDTRRLTEVPGGLTHFLQQGGAALIASDKPMQPAAKTALADATGVWITGFTWSQSTNLAVCYRNKDFCPFVQPFGPQSNLRFLQHPTQPRYLQVATNLPSTLDGGALPGGVKPFAKLPDTTLFWAPRSQPENIWVWVFGVAGGVGNGRVIVVADHSIFINEMMKPTDNGNVEFTTNCLMYLRGEHGQRKHVLFVDDGEIYESFAVGPKSPATERLDGLLDAANKGLNSWQDRLNEIDREDGFNKGLWDFAGLNDRRRLQSLIVRLLALATLGLLIYGCYRLGIASRYRREAALPSLPRAARQQQPRGSLLDLRHEGLLDAANIWETGRQLARDAFEAGGVPAPVPYHEPAVTFQGVGWWQRFHWRRRIVQLWRLAFHHKPAPLAPHAIHSLVAELEQLKAGLKRGTIQVT